MQSDRSPGLSFVRDFAVISAPSGGRGGVLDEEERFVQQQVV